MNREDWPNIKRLLKTGWPSKRDEQLDDGAYVSLLAAYPAGDVADAVRSLLAVKAFTPTPSEIVAAIPQEAALPSLSPDRERLLREKAVRDRLADEQLERDREREDSMSVEDRRLAYSRQVRARLDGVRA